MKPFSAPPEHKRKALETVASELRDAQDSDRDEILAARRALWRAEKAHDRAVAQAEREVLTARAPSPIDAYGHELILYDDRLCTPEDHHDLARTVRTEFTRSPAAEGQVELAVEGPGWQETVTGPARDEEPLRRLGRAIDAAAANVEAVTAARQLQKQPAEERLAAARTDLLGVEEAKPLLDHLGDLIEDGERIRDLAPGISTGHDGVLVVTDRRLLFVGLRHRLLLPYEQIADVHASGRWFGARLTITTAQGEKHVVSGLPARHAAEIAEYARRQLGAPSLGS